MTVNVAKDGTIMLDGNCPVEDAEELTRLLLLDPSATVDWRTCDALHTAVVQVLLAGRPPLRGPPRDVSLAQWIEPSLSWAKP